MAQGLYTVSVVSLPLNFTILLHPDSIASLGIEENGFALVKGVNGLITVVKVVQDQDCPATCTRITHSVQMTLGASPGDSVPILPFSGRDHCDAIQIAPLFDKNLSSGESVDFTSAVKQYFASDPRPISVDSIFTLLIDSEERAFKILKCSPTDRSFSSKSTKLYFTAEPGPLLPKPLISKHLNTLILNQELITFVKNNIYYPVNRQNVLRSLNLPTSTGIIIEGPPGCGKTSLLSAISNTINIPSIYCASKRLKKLSVSEYIEKLNQVFGYTAEKPQCLIMLDDIDYIVSSFRQSKITADRVKLATFFNLLDAVMNRSGVIVVATAVSSSTSMDPSLLRDGRFGQRIVLNQPTLEQRKELIRLYTGGMRVEDEDLNEIVRKIGGKNGESNSPSTVSIKEIERICRVAVTTLIEEATGNTGADIVDSLAVYTLNTKMKAMHFGVTSGGRGRSRPRREWDDDDEESGEHRRRRHHRRRHRYEDDDESGGGEDDDDDENEGSRRRRRHRHRRRRYEDDSEGGADEEDEDDEEPGRRRRRRRRDDEERSSSRRHRSHRSSRRRRNEDEDEEDDDDQNRRKKFDEEEEEEVGRRRGRRKNRSPFADNDEDDDEENDPFSSRKVGGRNRRGRNREDDEEDDDQDPFNRNKRPPARNSRKQGRNINNDEDDDDEADDMFNKRANKGSQGRRQPNRGRNMNDDDDEEFDEMDNRKRGSKSNRRNGGRGYADDDGGDDDEEDNSRRRRRNYNENEDGGGGRRQRVRRSVDVVEDDDDDEDDEPNPPPRRRNR